VDVDAVLAKNTGAYSGASVAVNKEKPSLVGTDSPMIARYIFRLTFGVLAVFLGLAIIAWVCYNEFIERLPQYGGFHWWEPFDLDRG
jgi:hypothetical protein